MSSRVKCTYTYNLRLKGRILGIVTTREVELFCVLVLLLMIFGGFASSCRSLGWRRVIVLPELAGVWGGLQLRIMTIEHRGNCCGCECIIHEEKEF